MRKCFWLLSTLWVLILSWCGWSMNVIEYNDTFVGLVNECTESATAIYNTFQADWTIDSIKELVQSSIDICRAGQEKAVNLWDYDKDSILKDEVVKLLSLEAEYMENFLATSVYRNIDDITEEDKTAYDWAVNTLYQAEAALNKQFTNLQDAQEAFAAKHWLNLE